MDKICNRYTVYWPYIHMLLLFKMFVPNPKKILGITTNNINCVMALLGQILTFFKECELHFTLINAEKKNN